MSGPQTYRQALLRINSTSMDDNRPVSVMRAWAVRNNTQHLIDQSPQHRINWTSSPVGTVGEADSYSLFADDGDRTVYYTQPFVHTVLDDRHPCGLDLRICGRVPVGGGTMTIDARIVPNVPSTPFDLSLDSYTGTQSGSTASTTGVELINYQWQPSNNDPPVRMHWLGVVATHGSRPEMVQICMSRLELKIVVPDGNQVDITQIHLREYC